MYKRNYTAKKQINRGIVRKEVEKMKKIGNRLKTI